MNRFFGFLIGISLIGVVVGCGQVGTETITKKPKKAAGGESKTESKEKENDHSGWWCEEHGVVESECSMCQKDVFKKLKKEDLCPKHPDRAKHQCFQCNPDLWEKSKAVYEAKYGTLPPEPVDNQPGKK